MATAKSAKSAKTKQTKQTNPKPFDPASYLYGFTSGQRGTVEMAVKARSLKIQTVGKTDDGTTVIGVTEGRRKTIRYEWIYDLGGYATTHDEYGSREKGGAIDLSILSYAHYLTFIEWKYSKIEPPGDPVASVGQTETAPPSAGDGVSMYLDRLFIKPSGTNPRKTFDDLDGLANSIRRHGIQQPIIVRKTGEMSSALMQEFYKLREVENNLRVKMDEARAYSVRPEANETDVKAFARALEKYAQVESAAEAFAQANAASLVAYEIIAGERRWRASRIAGLDQVPVIVRDVSDTTALELQIIENLQRRDVHPLEEADGYKNLLEKAGYTIHDVSVSVGKQPDFIHQRLVLNNLIKSAQKDLADGVLPIGHAMEIAKHTPEAQAAILEEHCYNPAYYYGSDRSKQARGTVTLKALKETIQKKILLDLEQAPFSLEDPKLRPDGLRCVECPQRTGFVPTLFGTDKAIANFCLNKSCFDLKCVNHVLNAQKAQTESVIKDTGLGDYAAPLVTGHYYGNDKFPGALDPNGYELIEDGEEKCAFAEIGISIDSEDAGHKFLVCRNPDCPTHGDEIESAFDSDDEQNSAAAKPAPDPAAELAKEREKKLVHKEEIFDARVGEPVRLRVLKQASDKFDSETSVFNHANAAFYQIELLIRLWRLQCSYSDRTAKDIVKILDLKEGQLSTSRWGHDFSTEIRALSPEIQSRLMFLLLYAHEGEFDLTYPGWTSQSAIRRLADEFGVDYQKLDAEQRLSEAPMKHKDMFRSYLHDLEAGTRDAAIPRMHTDKWKPESKEK